MIELERHIEILLLDNDCVMVPGLGGFMAHHVEARYDADEHLFLPPLRTLGFNPQLKLNDSLLAQSYVEAYDISYPEALRRIEDEVAELRQRLDNDGSYELNDIGVLSLNDEGNIVFEPCEAGILTPSLYGLSSFGMKRQDNAVEATQKVEQKRTVAESKVAEPVVSETVATADSKEDTSVCAVEDGERIIKIKVAWIRNTIAMAAAVLAFFFVTTPVSNSTQSDVSMSGIHSSLLLKLNPKELTKGEVKMPTGQVQRSVADSLTAADSISAAKVKADTAKTANAKTTAEGKGYCIVMASQVTRRNAEEFVEKLHKKGYDEAGVYVHNGMVRVVYGNYESESAAYKVLNKIRNKEYFEQSWVYKKK